jgi:hypothetical protein
MTIVTISEAVVPVLLTEFDPQRRVGFENLGVHGTASYNYRSKNPVLNAPLHQDRKLIHYSRRPSQEPLIKNVLTVSIDLLVTGLLLS